jgi:dynein heavy chain
VAVQVKTIQDAIRDKKQRFNFMGTDISLNPVVGLFITMVSVDITTSDILFVD